MKTLWMVCVWLGLSALQASHAQESSDHAGSAVRPLASIRFQQDDDVKCLAGALETGDPEKGPSTYILRAPPGCLVKWHYHTAQEQVVVVRGTLYMEMQDHAPMVLGPGGFAVMAGGVGHQFLCRSKTPCLLTVAFDKTYDIFWGRGRP